MAFNSFLKVHMQGIIGAYFKFPALLVNRFCHPMNLTCMKRPMTNRIKYYLGKYFAEQPRSTYTLNNNTVKN